MQSGTKRQRAGIIPYASSSRGEIYFLFGKEIYGKWSPFGGSVEEKETMIQAAAREFNEETMGFFDYNKIMDSINPEIKIISEEHDTISTYFLIPVDYVVHLPEYYKNVYRMMLQCTNGKKNKWGVPVLSTHPESGLFEKSELRWFSLKCLINIKKNVSRSLFNDKANRVMVELLKIEW